MAFSALAALVSPNGIELFRLPLRMLNMSFATSALSEWSAANFQGFEPLEMWIMLAILGGFSLGFRLPWTRTAMVLLLLHLALSHVRNMELLGIIGPLLIAAPLAPQLGSPGRASAGAEATIASHPLAATPLAAGMAVVIALGVVSTAPLLNWRGLHPREDIAPAAAVNAARAAGLDGHVLNSLRFGGYLMFVGIPTFIDGRADLFGDEFLARNAAASAGIGNALHDLLDQYAVDWTLLEPLRPPASLLDCLPGWERVYADESAVVHHRTTPRSEAFRGGHRFRNYQDKTQTGDRLASYGVLQSCSRHSDQWRITWNENSYQQLIHDHASPQPSFGLRAGWPKDLRLVLFNPLDE